MATVGGRESSGGLTIMFMPCVELLLVLGHVRRKSGAPALYYVQYTHLQ